MRFSLIILFLTIVAGCIPVEEISESWDKGVIDPELEGHWKYVNNESSPSLIPYKFISFNKGDGYYEFSQPKAPIPKEMLAEFFTCKCKTIMSGGEKYLLFNVESYLKKMYEASKKAAEMMSQESGGEIDKELLKEMIPKEKLPFKGMILRYIVEGDKLSFYVINEESLAQAMNMELVEGSNLETREFTSSTVLKRLDEKTLDFLSKISEDASCWSKEVFERIENLESELEKARKEWEEFVQQIESVKDSNIPVEPIGLKFFGDVVDESNEPIRNVNVSAYRFMFEGGPYYLPEIELTDEILSEDGSFEFTFLRDRESEEGEEYHYTDKVIILAEKEGYALGWEGKGLYDDPNCRVVLKSPTKFIGEVLNAGFEPVGGAEVRLILTNEERFYRNGTIYGVEPIECLKTITDEEGCFEFNNLPWGAKAQFIVSAKGYIKLITTDIAGYPGSRDKAPTVGKSRAVSLQLSRPCVIKGKVVEKTSGRGVENVKLCVTGIDITLQSEKKTFFCVSEGDGSFRIEDFIFGCYWVETTGDGDWKSKRTVFYVNEGETIKGDIEVTRGGKLTVNACDINSGKAIPNVNVEVRLVAGESKEYGTEKKDLGEITLVPLGKLTKYFNTDVNGLCSCILAEGKYEVVAGADDYEPLNKKVNIVAGETVSLEFVLGGRQYSILSVVDVNGKPMYGAVPQIFGDIRMNLPAMDSNGEFKFDRGYFNRYEGNFIVVRDSKRNLVGRAKIPKEFERLEIALQPGSRIKGRFVDERGKEIPNIKIKLFESGQLVKDFHGGVDEFFVSSEQGYFELPALLEGFEYEFMAEPEGYVDISKKIELRTSELDLGEIVLEDAILMITGFIVDDEGRPVGGIRVGGFGNERQPRISTVKTDEQGRFILAGVTDATVYVGTWDDDEIYRHVKKKCKGGDKNVKIVVDKRINAEVEVKIVDDKSGKPIEGMHINIYSEKLWDNSTEMDGEGKAYFTCPWRGRYDFRLVGLSQKDFKPRELEIKEDKDYNIEIRVLDINKWGEYI